MKQFSVRLKNYSNARTSGDKSDNTFTIELPPSIAFELRHQADHYSITADEYLLLAVQHAVEEVAESLKPSSAAARTQQPGEKSVSAKPATASTAAPSPETPKQDTTELQEQIIELAQTHPEYTHKEMAQEIGCSKGRVQQVLSKAGLSLRDLRAAKKANANETTAAEVAADTNTNDESPVEPAVVEEPPASHTAANDTSDSINVVMADEIVEPDEAATPATTDTAVIKEAQPVNWDVLANEIADGYGDGYTDLDNDFGEGFGGDDTPAFAD